MHFQNELKGVAVDFASLKVGLSEENPEMDLKVVWEGLKELKRNVVDPMLQEMS